MRSSVNASAGLNVDDQNFLTVRRRKETSGALVVECKCVRSTTLHTRNDLHAHVLTAESPKIHADSCLFSFRWSTVPVAQLCRDLNRAFWHAAESCNDQTS